MKTVLLTLSFLFFAFTARPSLATSEPVLDVDGDPLLSTRQYYILPTTRPGGGGVGLAKTGNQTRPLSVIQEHSFSNNGKRVVFKPASQEEYIALDRPLEIEFPEKPKGVSTGNWLLVNDLNDTWSVGIGSSIDYPGFPTLEGYFQIHEDGLYSYRISFRPFTRSIRSGVDIGRMKDNMGKIRLVAKWQEPYQVLFRKASSGVAKM